MIQPFRRVLEELEHTFRVFEAMVPPPTNVANGDGFVLRYLEKSLQQALLQKFARFISGLHALDLLAESGFCQEQGAIQRILMDIEEDVLFLVLGTSEDWTARHDAYLEHFWQEEPGAGMVPRDKIRAYVHSKTGKDPSTGSAAAKKLFKGYSGYVHANSVAVIDMCVGEPVRYHLRGMRGSPLYGDHVHDLWNYFFGGLVVAQVIAKAFGDDLIWAERTASRRDFEAAHKDRLF